MRYCFNFDQEFREGQFAYFYKRARGRVFKLTSVGPASVFSSQIYNIDRET